MSWNCMVQWGTSPVILNLSHGWGLGGPNNLSIDVLEERWITFLLPGIEPWFLWLPAVAYMLYRLLHPHSFCPFHIRGLAGKYQPFWISREPVAWHWCNLVASQRRPHCGSLTSHSPVGLVSRQWDAVDWACILCDHRIHNDRASRSASSLQCACPF